MNTNRYKGIKRCKSMPTIDDESVGDVVRKQTVKKVTTRINTSKREYMGRRSLGVATASSKVKRKKSKTERDRDIQDDMYDEGYEASSTSSSSSRPYRCIPILERSNRSSQNYLPSVETSSSDSDRDIRRPPLLYSTALLLTAPPSLSVESLTDKLEQLEVSDRNKLHLEITQFLKKADGEKKKQMQMSQRLMNCPQFGQTMRLIVEESANTRYTFENILWLILKAYFSASSSGRDIMIGKSEWMAEDESIAKARKQYMMVMDMIKDFKFEFMKNDKEDTLFDSLNRRMEFSPDYCESLREARKRIKRMTSMRVWLNTLNDMNDKFEALGVLFEVDSIDGGEWFKPLDESNQIFALEDVRLVFLEYVKKSLNLKGMKKVLTRVEKIIELTLVKTAILMQKPPPSYAAATASRGSSFPFNQLMRERYGDMSAWRFCNATSLSLNLPPLTHLFFFLVAVPMQLVVQWLEIRSATEPPDSSLLDELTFDAMITDSRDCVEEAVRIKKNYLTILQSMCSKCAMPGFLYPLKYNTYVLDVFKKYIHYVKCWSNCDTVRKEPSLLFSRLEMEWTSAVQCAQSVKSAISLLCITYSDIVESLIREVVEDFAVDQIEEIRNRYNDPGESEEDNDDDDDLEVVSSPTKPFFRHPAYHQFMLEINQLIREVKERELRVFSLLRMTLNDSHDAVGYDLRQGSDRSILLNEMVSDFCLIQLVMVSDDGNEDEDLVNLPIVMFVYKTSADKSYVETCMLAISEGRKIDDGCIVIVPDKDNELQREWKGRVVKIVIDEETRICYRMLRDDVTLCLTSQNVRTVIEQKYSKFFKCSAPACSSNFLINSRIQDLTEGPLLNHLDEERNRIAMLLGKMGGVDQQRERALSSLGFKLEKHFLVAFQIYRDVAKIVSDSFMEFLGRKMIDKALMLTRQWMQYVRIKNSVPSPTLPMWATPGFTFLQFITEPKWSNPEIMTDEQFQEFSDLVKQFEAKIIQSSSNMSTPIVPKQRMTRSTSSKTSSSSVENQRKSRKENQMLRVQEIEEKRNKIDLDNRQIGKVITDDNRRHFVLATDRKFVTRAPFQFALLDEIASGTFGTVHRAMDIDSHRVIAAKVMAIRRENHKAIESEINIFRQLTHENLVKYYGVEVEDNYVIIFMEFCSEGTLERICHGKMDLKMVRQKLFIEI
uniref:Protein kinase domain-containing protein n=1 Tax=Caenorhabditis tropicalis TaxID=1561998 RepID=A0A1I7UL65_9PELO